MKKVVSLILVVCFALVVIACGSKTPATSNTPAANTGTEQTKPADDTVYEMIISHQASSIDPVNVSCLIPFAEYVEKESNGRIKVSSFVDGQLSNSNEEDAEKVNQNIAHMTSVPVASMVSQTGITAYQIFAMPYAFPTDDDLYAFADAGFGEKYAAEAAKKSNLRVYPCVSIGRQKISTTKIDLSDPANLKNAKIRIMNDNVLAEFMKALGAVGTPVAWGETYTALQQGTVDGMMTSTNLYISNGFYNVQKYIMDADATPVLHFPILSQKWYDTLPADLQELIDKAMVKFWGDLRPVEKQTDIDSLNELGEKYGMVVCKLTDEQRKEIVEKTAYIIDEMGPSVCGQEVIDMYKAWKAGR